MRFIRSLTQPIDPAEVSLAGSKAARLAALSSIARVPPGFVILNSCYRESLLQQAGREATRLLAAVAHSTEPLPNLFDELHTLVSGLRLPEDAVGEVYAALEPLANGLLAVRSSASVEDGTRTSYAGAFATFLDVPPAAAPSYVPRCWASLFSRRASFYATSRDRALGETAMAVVVQSMVPARRAGVCFALDPLTRSRDQMVVEVVTGNGDALVSGLAQPTTYWMNAATGTVANVIFASASGAAGAGSGSPEVPTLSEAQLYELATVARAASTYFSAPQDIEFAFAEDGLWLLQSRPITFPPR